MTDVTQQVVMLYGRHFEHSRAQAAGRPTLRSGVGVPGGIRTHDPPLRRRPLYPLSYGDTEVETPTVAYRAQAGTAK